MSSSRAPPPNVSTAFLVDPIISCGPSTQKREPDERRFTFKSQQCLREFSPLSDLSACHTQFSDGTRMQCALVWIHELVQIVSHIQEIQQPHLTFSPPPVLESAVDTPSRE